MQGDTHFSAHGTYSRWLQFQENECRLCPDFLILPPAHGSGKGSYATSHGNPAGVRQSCPLTKQSTPSTSEQSKEPTKLFHTQRYTHTHTHACTHIRASAVNRDPEIQYTQRVAKAVRWCNPHASSKHHLLSSLE